MTQASTRRLCDEQLATSPDPFSPGACRRRVFNTNERGCGRSPPSPLCLRLQQVLLDADSFVRVASALGDRSMRPSREPAVVLTLVLSRAVDTALWDNLIALPLRAQDTSLSLTCVPVTASGDERVGDADGDGERVGESGVAKLHEDAGHKAK